MSVITCCVIAFLCQIVIGRREGHTLLLPVDDAIPEAMDQVNLNLATACDNSATPLSAGLRRDLAKVSKHDSDHQLDAAA